MKKILIYGNRKADDTVWDISTKEKEEKAFWALFKILDKSYECYSFLSADSSEYLVTQEDIDLIEKIKNAALKKYIQHQLQIWAENYRDELEEIRHYHLYKKAKKKDFKALMELLYARRDYEYENWRIERVE